MDKLATDPVGTGPYEFGKWNRGDSITLYRNDNYWGKKPVLQDRALQVLQGPHGAQQRPADRHHQRGRHRADARVARRSSSSNSKYQVIEGTTNGEVVLSFNNGPARR